MAHNNLKGTGVALVTPFDNDHNIDFDGLKSLIDHVSEGGVEYLVVCGTTGESITMTAEEQAKVLAFIKDNNNKQLPMVYGIGGSNTAALLEQMKTVDLTGVAAVLSSSPAYNKPSQAGIIAHYEKLADNCPVPIILYNVPGRTASNLTAATTLHLTKHANIIGIKEASGDLSQCMAIAKDKPEDFLLISGDDMLASSIIAFGGIGVISVLANAFPKNFSEMVRLALDNDIASSSKLLLDFVEVNPLMYAEANPVGVKQALAELGICGAEVRLPLVKATDSLQRSISIAISKMRN